jgi:hypothetical protein
LKSASNVDDALLPLPKHVPFTAKQPAVILNPLAAVVEPVLLIVNSALFVVPPAIVDDEMENRFVVVAP